jgi:hypothetical protein
MAGLPAKRRAKVEARAAELIAEELSLQDLRKEMSKIQVSMAKKLHVGQGGISRLEKRAVMLLSTLRITSMHLAATCISSPSFPTDLRCASPILDL